MSKIESEKRKTREEKYNQRQETKQVLRQIVMEDLGITRDSVREETTRIISSCVDTKMNDIDTIIDNKVREILEKKLSRKTLDELDTKIRSNILVRFSEFMRGMEVIFKPGSFDNIKLFDNDQIPSPPEPPIVRTKDH